MPPKKIKAPIPVIPIRHLKDINYLNVEFLLRTTNFDVNQIASYLNGKTEQKLTLLTAAIYNRDEKLVDHLLEKNADVNLKLHPYSRSLAHFAVEIDDGNLLRKLITYGININDDSLPGKQTILFNAAYNGKFEMVKILVENGANVHHQDIHKTTPLMVSTSYEVTKILLEKGAEVNAMSDFCGSALMQAARSSDFPRMKLLLAKGAEINCIKVNCLGTEPMIHFLTRTIQTDSFKFFLHLNDKLDVNMLNDKNETALHVLVTRPLSSCDNEKWLPLIQELLNAGINLNQEDIEGKLAIECSTGRNYRCISEVKKHIVKLICLGCVFVCPRNRSAVDDQRYDKLKIICEEEFKVINNTCLIDSSVTYLDVLKKSVDDLMVELRGVDILGIMGTELAQIFPNYGVMIYYKLLKVTHKMKLYPE